MKEEKREVHNRKNKKRKKHKVMTHELFLCLRRKTKKSIREREKRKKKKNKRQENVKKYTSRKKAINISALVFINTRPSRYHRCGEYFTTFKPS